ncbi:ATP synthase subunit I [Sporosarcina pasteurii]|uniref:ATP synthase I chain n=1 Tax=Sporosarcina pasteurii TaxID=1474 RepID=A0A380BCL7_SPOPA|nr:ATP synthase subunit I [Sporosarcina pasteurii]MDS9472276.1 ATP synthase subunit I [Sporosarcina pasteurii]QBQ06257.1 ATP synthase subunit I [Sporosarcina pasteurii]SUI99102.1 ATP synthase I chain [Sporosarcina pasteurii]
MQNLQEIHSRQRKLTFFTIALFALGWVITGWNTVFAGLILGTLFGLYNFWILVRKSERFERAFAEGKSRISIGSALRFASGIAAAAIATAMPEQFDLISTVIGFAIPYALLVVERIIYHVRQQ